MGKKSAKSPDVVGAARTEGEMNRETARDTTYADRPDQYNQYGNVQWGTEQVRDPATGEMVTKWTQNQSLNPTFQGLFDQQTGMMQNRGNLAGGMNDRINSEMGGAPDWDQFGGVIGMDFDPTTLRQSAEDAAYQRSTNRLDPRFAAEGNKLEIDLRNKGLRPGDQAYDSAMSTYGNTKNDAYEQARLGATGEGRAEAGQLWGQSVEGNQIANSLRNQQIQEYLDKRGFSLGEQDRLNQGQTLADLRQTTQGGDS